MYPHQAQRLTEALDAAGLAALVASSPANVAYITGFRSLTEAIFHTPQLAVFTRSGTALVTPAIDPPTVVADGIDVDHVVPFGGFRVAAAEPPPAETKRVLDMLAARAASPADAVAAALERLDVRGGAVGVDESGLTWASWRALETRLTAWRLSPAAGHLLAARRVKSPYEIESLQRALHLVEEALNAVIQSLDAGMTEREVARAFATALIERGGTPLPALVAAGDGTAVPAPWPGDRALRRGDLVRLDVGGAYRGCHASVARMAVLGEPRAADEAAFEGVQAALEAAIDTVRPGVPASAVHAAAVAAARAGGLPRFERYHVGHGIGLEPYERPKLAAGIDTPLTPGEILRLETPYFELGARGLNVRETVLVTTGGARVLNRSARGLCVLD